MTDSPQSNRPRDRFNDIVVPTAKGLEKFFWNLAWFALLCILLFGGTCISRFSQQGGPREQQHGADAAGSTHLSDLQHASEVED